MVAKVINDETEKTNGENMDTQIDEKFSNFGGCLTDEDVLERTKKRCAHCGVVFGIEGYAHHTLLPARLGGSLSDLDNVVMLCTDCLERYTNKFYMDWSVEFPFLDKNEALKATKYVERKLNDV